MRKLLAELLLAAQSTSTQHWQKQGDAAASMGSRDSGLFCEFNYDLYTCRPCADCVKTGS